MELALQENDELRNAVDRLQKIIEEKDQQLYELGFGNHSVPINNSNSEDQHLYELGYGNHSAAHVNNNNDSNNNVNNNNNNSNNDNNINNDTSRDSGGSDIPDSVWRLSNRGLEEAESTVTPSNTGTVDNTTGSTPPVVVLESQADNNIEEAPTF